MAEKAPANLLAKYLQKKGKVQSSTSQNALPETNKKTEDDHVKVECGEQRNEQRTQNRRDTKEEKFDKSSNSDIRSGNKSSSREQHELKSESNGKSHEERQLRGSSEKERSRSRERRGEKRRSWTPPASKFRKLDATKDLTAGKGYKVQDVHERLINYSVEELRQRQAKMGSELTLIDRKKFLKDFHPSGLKLSNEHRKIYEQNPHMRQVFANKYPFCRAPEPFSIRHRLASAESVRKPYQRRLGHAKTVEHWGQRKLLFSEIEFLTLYGDPTCLVIYAGAAPGTHIPFLSELFPLFCFLLVDPAPFNITSTERIQVVQDYFTDEMADHYRKTCHGNCLFISDVRSVSMEMQDAEKEDRVAKDMERQMNWHLALNPVASMLKMRLPYPAPPPSPAGATEYLDGIVYFPVWGGRTTTESRLVVIRDDHSAQFAQNIEEMDRKVLSLSSSSNPDISSSSTSAPPSRSSIPSLSCSHLTPDTPLLHSLTSLSLAGSLPLSSSSTTSSASSSFMTSTTSDASAATLNSASFSVSDSDAETTRFIFTSPSISASYVSSLPLSSNTATTAITIVDSSTSTSFPTLSHSTSSSSFTSALECELPSKWKTKMWCHRDYEELMFHFNTETRTTYFDHDLGNFLKTKGLCHCFDCSSEIYILKYYCLKEKRASSLEAVRESVLMLSDRISGAISNSKSSVRTLTTGWDIGEKSAGRHNEGQNAWRSR